MRTLGWIVVAVLSVAAVLTLDPEWVGVVVPGWAGLTVTYPVNQVIALRALLAGVFGVIAVIMLVVGLVRKLGFRAGTHSLVLALVLALVGVGHFGYLWMRGIHNPAELGPDRGVRPADTGDGSVTVLALNTQGGASNADDVAAVAEETGADVLVLTETVPQLAEQIASFLTGDGESFQVFTAGDGQDAQGATAILVSETLGEYVGADGPDTRLGSVRAEPASGAGPVFVGVHTVPPVEDQHEQWLTDLETVSALCHDGADGLVLAGDLNATLDHAPLQDLGGCADAAVEAEVGGVSTWPTSLPELLGAPIDHVLLDSAAYETTQARVVETGDSDHRGLVVRVRPREG
ncbi:endonuclease/exonuclease/phosphatase family protein [Georgenia alba]|uniref:Endonuclease/exonuclease/phosphatase family protein n=1 Tax=Georgenia alba TaxID=2233858 RepID=A0ABW2Q4E8_9MICO